MNELIESLQGHIDIAVMIAFAIAAGLYFFNMIVNKGDD